MAPPPFDLALQLRQHGSAVRRLAMELLRDGAAADDAAQETWVRAVQHPPRHEDAVGGWLATIVHNVARKLRRSERRRLRREAVAAQLRASEVEDHSTAMAREELVHRLVTAVTSLDAPFREAIWQRYFEGLAPREIAAASGVPLATVKSRLQRGLGLLREKLGEREGTDWRAGLVAAFGWQEGVVGSGTAAATMWPGVLLMTAWMKSAAAVLVVLGAGLVWWSLREQAAPVPVVVVDAGKDASAVSASLGVPAQERALAAVSPAVERTAVEPAVAANPKNATLRGRCVDENRAPLADCTVVLGGRPGDATKDGAWERDQKGAPERKPSIAQTAADGTFAFEFWPPPSFDYVLDVMRDDLIPMTGRWPSIAEGERIDLGDVVCTSGIRVTGKVVDQAGRPVARAFVNLVPTRADGQLPAKAGQMSKQASMQRQTAADGTLAFRTAVPVGDYRLHVIGREVASPALVTLALDRPKEVLEVVVVGTAEVLTIRGHVVDEKGAPVRAWVHSSVARGSCPLSSVSQEDGSFVIDQPQDDPPTAVRLTAAMDGLDTMAPTEPVAWGTRDVVLRVTHASGITLRLVDAQDAPILDYGVRMLPQGGVGWLGGGDLRERAHGPFPGGVAVIPAIKHGKWLVIVDFVPNSPFLQMREMIEFVEGGTNVFTLRAETGARRQLRVLDTAGVPIAGTRVQLCDLAGRAFGMQTRVFEERRWLLNQWNPNTVLLQFDGTTDAEGRVLLVGRGQRPLGMRVLGPGHLPLERSDVRLDMAGELLVSVQRGARITGKITPPTAMAELRRLAGAESNESFPADSRPFLQLVGEANVRVPTYRHMEEGWAALFQVEEDGSFDVTGLPPGAWKLQVAYSTLSGKIRSGEAAHVQDLILAEGEWRRLDCDLGALLPGTLEATITLNHQTFANGKFWLERIADAFSGGQSIQLETDAQGAFSYFGQPGAYTVSVDDVQATTPATLVFGTTTRAAFAVETGTLLVRVLDGAGNAVAGLSVRGPDDLWQLPLTSGDGTASAKHAPGAVALRVLPKRLLDRAQLQKVYAGGIAAGEKDPLASLWIEVGTATITAGETTTLELRLPPEWEK
jgi:RNA polymerase sigma factor (sigma-70 family)